MTQIRDVERIRELLLDIKFREQTPKMLKVSNDHDRYQYTLMKDAGLFVYEVFPMGSNEIRLTNVRITNLGHDFIDAFESEENFEGAKKFAKEKGQELLKLPFDLMISFGKQYIKEKLGL